MTQSHVAVVGAGIVGMAAAGFLRRRGFAVTVIDPLPPGEGCSFGNAGGIAFAEVMPPVHARVLLKIPGWLLDPLGPLTIRWSYLLQALPWFLAAGRNALPSRVRAIVAARAALGLRAVADFEEILGPVASADLIVKRDSLRLYDSEAQRQAEATEWRLKAEHGYEMTPLTGGELRELEPAISTKVACGAFHGGWYFVRNPERVVKTIAEAFVRAGGVIMGGEVKALASADGRVTDLTLASGERLAVDRLVICAGAYSHLLTRLLGENVPLEAERGYHMVLPDPGVALTRSITYARTPGAATPMEMGLRLAGTDEFAGLEAPPNYARSDALWHHFKRVLPDLKEPDARATRWMGRRPGLPDSLPVIGPSRSMANVWYGFGHGHMGLTWGPTTGRLLGEIVSGAKPNLDLSAFRVDRF